MGLSVTVLGCSGTYPHAGGACTGYLVQSERTNLWLDTGPGTLANLQQHLDLHDLHGIVLTHSHPDHWLDLPVLRNALRYVLDIDHVPIAGTDETHLLADALCGGGLAPTFDWTTIHEDSAFEVGDLRCTFARTDHPVETLAVRIEGDGRTLAFSADSGPRWSVESLGPGIDLALIEASLDDELEGKVQHLSGSQAGRMARAAGCAKLVITHVVPGADGEEHRRRAEAAFGAQVELAQLHARYEV